MKPFKRHPEDEVEKIYQIAMANTAGLRGIEEAIDFTTIYVYLPEITNCFRRIDREMTQLCLDNEPELLVWSGRMGLIASYLKKFEECLKEITSGRFDWNEALRIMGLLEAFRTGADLTIQINQAGTSSTSR